MEDNPLAWHQRGRPGHPLKLSGHPLKLIVVIGGGGGMRQTGLTLSTLSTLSPRKGTLLGWSISHQIVWISSFSEQNIVECPAPKDWNPSWGIVGKIPSYGRNKPKQVRGCQPGLRHASYTMFSVNIAEAPFGLGTGPGQTTEQWIREKFSLLLLPRGWNREDPLSKI